jgi:ParB-like chromosome segregation protein Spo0J
MTTTTDVSKQAIELWDIADLKPHPRNAKKHSQEQIERLARSILRLGVNPPMIEPDGTIIAGHGRRLAVMHLGRTKIPVIVRRDLTKIECDALRIADNAAVSTEMDYDILTEETVRLSEEGFDLADLGMNDAEIKALTTDIGEIDDTAFTDDISAAVEDQKAENAKRESEIDEKQGPVAAAFGFKKVTTEQSRVIRGFMSKIEAETNLTGAEALVAHIVA